MSGLAYINSAQAATTTVSIPSHEQGDFILGIAISNASFSAPSTPSGQNWSTETSAGGLLNSGTLFYKFAQNSSESFGTSVGADQVLVAIYKGVRLSDPFGTNVFDGAVGASNYNFGSMTMEETDNSSWMIGWGYTEAGSPTFSAISGTTQRLASGRITFADTALGLNSWSNTSASLGGGGYTTQNANFELKAQPYSGGLFF